MMYTCMSPKMYISHSTKVTRMCMPFFKGNNASYDTAVAKSFCSCHIVQKSHVYTKMGCSVF